MRLKRLIAARADLSSGFVTSLSRAARPLSLRLWRSRAAWASRRDLVAASAFSRCFALFCVEVQDEGRVGAVLRVGGCVVGDGGAGRSIVACVGVVERRHFGCVELVWVGLELYWRVIVLMFRLEF